MVKREIQIGTHTLSIETGRLAKQADGAAVVRMGDTMVIVTASLPATSGAMARLPLRAYTALPAGAITSALPVRAASGTEPFGAKPGTANDTSRAPDGALTSATPKRAPGASATSEARLFAGAKEVAAISGYETNLGIKRFDLMIDWGWFYFITKPMFHLMDYFFHLVGNFGVAILLTTIVVKLLFFPLANKQYASMANMKRVQPKMEELKEKYKDDRMGLQQAMMQLYKDEKINPVAGCWPVLLQIPVFFALYKVIYVTIEMRHAPFFGWIRDLSAPDPTNIFTLFGLIPWTPPSFLWLGAWPLIMGFTMWAQQKLNPQPPDPVQAKVFAFMPIIFTFMLAHFPAGLVIYWAWNNLLSIIQQWTIMRTMGVKP